MSIPGLHAAGAWYYNDAFSYSDAFKINDQDSLIFRW